MLCYIATWLVLTLRLQLKTNMSNINTKIIRYKICYGFEDIHESWNGNLNMKLNNNKQIKTDIKV